VIMQTATVSEATYGMYIIHPCFMEMLAGVEKKVYYEP
jgi:hypothetical protein